jgi:hypothetical protein
MVPRTLTFHAWKDAWRPYFRLPCTCSISHVADAGMCKRLETNVELHGVNKQRSVEARGNVAVPRIMSTLDLRVKSGSFNDML